jgi:DNA-binding LacI/PurR family transcriptional regulator
VSSQQRPDPPGATPARPGLADVARRAGVSVATASRALSGAGPASERARRDVLAAAEALGYRPHPVARSLARRGGTRIVLAFRDARASILEDPFVARATAAVATVADPGGLGVGLRRLPLDCRAALDDLAGDRGVTAVVLAGHDRSVEVPPGLRGRTALIGAGLPGLVRADVDSAAGVGALAGHLYETGRRRIALVRGPRWLASSRAPLDAYVSVVRAAGLPVRIVPGDFTARRGRVAASEILRRWPDTDAIVAVTDATALGVLQFLAARGVRVPADIALTGFDDIPLAAAVHPALSTATHPVERIAAAAARAALSGRADDKIFPSRPVLRDST